MRILKIVLFVFFLTNSSFANEVSTKEVVTAKQEELDRLDMLDQQSKDFYMAVTGLEKEYLEEQMKKTKEQNERENVSKQKNTNAQGVIISDEEKEKNLFQHQNELARITTDFTRTKKLKDLKIKGMYTFNGVPYVVLLLDDETNRVKPSTELSGNIEGRYILGDKILGHKIVNINTRTKSVELFKDLDKSTGYTLYLSNYGITLSSLEKIDKNHPRYEQITGIKEQKKLTQSTNRINSSLALVKEDKEKEKLVLPIKTNIDNSCLIVNKNRLNVRQSPDLEAMVLKILENGDIVKISSTQESWVKLDTIYYKDSKRVVNVENQNNWIQNLNQNLVKIDCKEE